MKKDIYKDIPENFHRQFCQTLMELEDTPHADSSLGSVQHTPPKSSHTSHKRRRRKYGIFLAAAILVCACASVAAAGLMGWHKRMSEHFGTDRALEDKLSAEQAAIPQSAAVDDNQLKFQALQAVRTDSYDYFLLRMTLPEGIDWNDDIIFEDARVLNQDIGCIANFVNDSLEGNTVLLEIQLLYSGEAAPDTGEVRVHIKNLIQTRKTELFDYLVKGEWEIPLTLPPAQADTVRFYPQQTVNFGEHELCFTQVDISPFRLRLYTKKEPAMHAAWGHSIFLSAVGYKDGSAAVENGLAFSLSGHQDESGSFCFEFPLENAVDPDRVAEIIINDGGEERILSLTIPQSDEKIRDGDGKQNSAPLPAVTKTGQLSDLRLLYVKYGNVVLADEQSLYLWDADCSKWKELLSLSAYNFSWDNGGEISLGQASQIMLLPCEGSSDVYLYDIATREILTLDTATFWPWPVHESYQANCKTITEVIPDADEKYSGQTFFSQGKWYYLYSEDGTIQNMELRSQE